MKKSKKLLVSLIVAVPLFTIPATVFGASSNTYTVVSGDALWKVAAKTKTNIKDLIAANPQLKNIHVINPGQN